MQSLCGSHAGNPVPSPTVSAEWGRQGTVSTSKEEPAEGTDSGRWPRAAQL